MDKSLSLYLVSGYHTCKSLFAHDFCLLSVSVYGFSYSLAPARTTWWKKTKKKKLGCQLDITHPPMSVCLSCFHDSCGWWSRDDDNCDFSRANFRRLFSGATFFFSDTNGAMLFATLFCHFCDEWVHYSILIGMFQKKIQTTPCDHASLVY